MHSSEAGDLLPESCRYVKLLPFYQSAQVLPSTLFFSCTHVAMTDSHKYLCLFSIQATTAVVAAAMTIVVAAAVTAEVAATAVTDIKRYYLDPTIWIYHESACCALRVLN
jgi:hypothetical protein